VNTTIHLFLFLQRNLQLYLTQLLIQEEKLD
jgi:hypothetical protein